MIGPMLVLAGTPIGRAADASPRLAEEPGIELPDGQGALLSARCSSTRTAPVNSTMVR